MSRRLIVPGFRSSMWCCALAGVVSCASSEPRLVATHAATSPVTVPLAPVAPVAAPAKGESRSGAQSLELALDVPQSVDGLELVWTAVEDSRCPEDVTCVWAGQVTVHVRVKDGGDARELSLTLGVGDSASVDTEHHRLRLTAVTPYPRSTASVDRALSRASLEVSRR